MADNKGTVLNFGDALSIAKYEPVYFVLGANRYLKQCLDSVETEKVILREAYYKRVKQMMKDRMTEEEVEKYIWKLKKEDVQKMKIFSEDKIKTNNFF